MNKLSVAVLSLLLAGCFSKTVDDVAPVMDTTSPLVTAPSEASRSSALATTNEAIKDSREVIKDGSEAIGNQETLEQLQTELASQKALLDDLLQEQQHLKEQLKRASLTIDIKSDAMLNAGKGRQPTATTLYTAVLEDPSQFADVQALAVKDTTLIPGRQASVTVNVGEDARYLALRVDLRYTKKRSQFLIPLDSIDYDAPLVLHVGACDAYIESGLATISESDYSNKLQQYQQPLVRCR